MHTLQLVPPRFDASRIIFTIVPALDLETESAMALARKWAWTGVELENNFIIILTKHNPTLERVATWTSVLPGPGETFNDPEIFSSKSYLYQYRPAV